MSSSGSRSPRLLVAALLLIALPAGAARAQSASPPGDSVPATPGPDDAHLEIHVEKPALPRPGSCSPVFPDKQRRAGVAGQVVVRFVVDTRGRVEKESFAVVSSTDPVFERAVRKSLGCMRFVPGELAGRKVRQVVIMPYEFNFAR